MLAIFLSASLETVVICSLALAAVIGRRWGLQIKGEERMKYSAR
jgi:hypothetical protein